MNIQFTLLELIQISSQVIKIEIQPLIIIILLVYLL